MLADRYIGMDVQKFETWAITHLRATDHVALEATTNSWAFHDKLEPIVKSVCVANTFKLKLISSSSIKTDKHDALALARLSAAQLLPNVWVPPQHVRELRNFTDHRSQLIQERTAAKNRLHTVLHRNNLCLPEGNPFKIANQVLVEETAALGS